ncbi:hypothetical protein ES332_D06G009100v1 [Gossypium tomentosum]|uniref:Tetrapyrrole methylase domain-containing protein n=1 Tax=Gossypium tomentosum TaxID=34277 RepID=A0A5D2KF79_GOSTO|nr:hypothetical protein ES332_D06G009100v1 [Gossypium tomentosum]
MLLRRLPSTAVSLATAALSRRSTSYLLSSQRRLQSFNSISFYPTLSFRSFCSTSEISPEFTDLITDQSSKRGPLKPGLYLVGTPIGNLEDITLRALRVLKTADVILSEDTRHSGKLLHYYNIKTPLLSYHKYNESQREHKVLKRLKQGEIVALISDAGMPGISDPGTELFWRGTLGTAKEAFSTRQPKGEITLLIEGNSNSSVETPSESQLENDLRELISNGHSLSSAVKLVAEGTSMKKKTIYSLALRKFVKKT